ncbi:MAG TPA: asparagine synthase (glutamine-hydrolyzing) [Terriglobales bacterium]|nr:asparagine synthase (glutamine-hydrolyzing) [Terriglobales bacterium]
MCAIAGICNSTNAPVNIQLLKDMIAMLRHRGPDEWGIHSDAGIGLANARLSIIDLNRGHQPLCNEDGSIWITFNGEIFNFVELRKELISRGHIFSTHSDTEVILHLYEEKGEDCFRDLNGQWGLAIWDARERKLLLSRDRLGVRPVFYTQVGDNLIFGSEMKALFVNPAVGREIDLVGLDQIFTFWCTLPPRTIFNNILELPPGNTLTFKNGQISVHPYWHLSFDSPEQTPADDACIEQLTALLNDAVRIRLRSDVPVGAYLSGGLDSTIVTALINQVSTEQLRTFSVAFTSEDLDERAYQQEAVRFLQTRHEQMECGYEDIVSVFPDVIWHTEKPVIRTAAAPLYLLSQQVHDQGYKVVLTGEGADEILGGYDIYKEAKVRRFLAAQPGSPQRAKLLRRLYPYQSNLQRMPDAYLRLFFRATAQDIKDPFFSHMPRWELTSRLKTFFSDDVKSELADHDVIAELLAQLPVAYFDWDSFCQAQYLETKYLLPGYILSSQGDRVALAHAVEARHPYLDYRLVDFASTLPPRLKMKALNEKYILKCAFGHLVPKTILKRPKQPYRSPDGRSFFAGFGPDYLMQVLTPERISADGIFDPWAVSKLIGKFRAGEAIGVKDDMALVGILSTQLVLDQFITKFQRGGSLCTENMQSCAVS